MDNTEILLKIVREYSQDEKVKILVKGVKELSFKNGELLSEVEELKSEIEKLRQIPTSNGKTKRQWMQDAMFADVNKEVRELRLTNLNLNRKMKRMNEDNIRLLIANSK